LFLLEVTDGGKGKPKKKTRFHKKRRSGGLGEKASHKISSRHGR